MLVLTRNRDQTIVLDGGRIMFTILEIRQGRVKVGIVAPDDMRIDREEVFQARIANGHEKGAGS